MDKDLNTRKRKKSIEDAVRNVKKSVRNGSGMCCGLSNDLPLVQMRLQCKFVNSSELIKHLRKTL